MTGEQFNDCINRILKDDKDALREIYEEYSGYIYLTVYSVLNHTENAEDVTSAFFIRLWEKADTYKAGMSHKAWMVTIARNMAVDSYRKHHKEDLTGAFSGSEEDSEDDVAEKNIRRGETVSEVENQVCADMTVDEILAVLKPAEREVVLMKVQGEMTFQEIAKLTGLPMGTVTWRYKNAMDKLRRYGYE